MEKPKRIRHDYTNEVELKSLAMREKNKFYNVGTQDANAEINSLIQEYLATKDPKLKDIIFDLSKDTQIDKNSHERFGEIVLLMVKKILTKPNYSGYSWVDEFYSTSCYRVFKYIHNFDFEKKSKRTNQGVSAFSYITQIIIMSILEVINKNNKSKKDAERYAEMHNSDFGIYGQSKSESTYMHEIEPAKEIIIEKIENSLYDEIVKIQKSNDCDIKIYYPHSYIISFDEFAKIKPLLKAKNSTSIIKLRS